MYWNLQCVSCLQKQGFVPELFNFTDNNTAPVKHILKERASDHSVALSCNGKVGQCLLEFLSTLYEFYRPCILTLPIYLIVVEIT